MPPRRPLVLVAGNTEPSLLITVRRAGQVVDLTGKAVVARIERENLASIERALVVVDGPAGRARLDWLVGDLASPPGQPGSYAMELTVDGVETSPVPLRFVVRPPLPAP